MTHPRACPECNKIIPWTLEEPVIKKMPNGEMVPVRHVKLICPEHGEFRNRAEQITLHKIDVMEI